MLELAIYLLDMPSDLCFVLEHFAIRAGIFFGVMPRSGRWHDSSLLFAQISRRLLHMRLCLYSRFILCLTDSALPIRRTEWFVGLFQLLLILLDTIIADQFALLFSYLEPLIAIYRLVYSISSAICSELFSASFARATFLARPPTLHYHYYSLTSFYTGILSGRRFTRPYDAFIRFLPHADTLNLHDDHFGLLTPIAAYLLDILYDFAVFLRNLLLFDDYESRFLLDAWLSLISFTAHWPPPPSWGITTYRRCYNIVTFHTFTPLSDYSHHGLS